MTRRGGTEFKRRYFAELAAQGEALDELRKLAHGKTVTLFLGRRMLSTAKLRR